MLTLLWETYPDHYVPDEKDLSYIFLHTCSKLKQSLNSGKIGPRVILQPRVQDCGYFSALNYFHD